MQLLGGDPYQAGDLPDCAAALSVVRDQLDMRKPAGPDQPPAAAMGHPVGELAKREVHALLANALTTEAPFRERLVWFWANHFTVSARGLVPAACAGAYVREAIRPHVTGRFADMLLAVMRHPAMLAYLNNERSAGPGSRAGIAHNIGLNENLARESLELHSVSPASGYTQADVTNYAKILTGWSIEAKRAPLGFVFRPNLHEPGEIEVMGRTWPAGEQGGMAILEFLGTHPATYRHIAEKLVRHFVADEPHPDQVRRIALVLRDTQGDLAAASLAITEVPQAWIPGSKLRTPQEFVVGCLRAIGATPEMVPNLGGLVGGLGQGMFQAPFPIGWPDRAADWAGPEAMLQRVDFAYVIAGRAGNLDPVTLAQATLGPILTADTLGQITSAGSRRDALTMLLASPEFQRR
jgi:uncharacterized protein (DUF1800 family)